MKSRRKHEEPSSLEAFLDSALEGRRLFSEALGTFLLVLAAAGGATVAYWSHGAVSLAMAVTAPGLMVMATIYFMGAVGGAHLNSAVTFAFALRRNFPWRRVPGYILAQFFGAMAAMYVLYVVFGAASYHGATVPDTRLSSGAVFAVEGILTMGLVAVILGTSSGARNIGTNGAIAVGGYIALAGLWSAPATGASMNPFRTLAPDIFRGDFSSTWIYILAQFSGAVIGVVFEWILKGPPTEFGTKAAQGDLGMIGQRTGD